MKRHPNCSQVLSSYFLGSVRRPSDYSVKVMLEDGITPLPSSPGDFENEAL